jgi:UDPglucose--hexose-1-phosphate uridylyltransferase
MSLPLDSSNQPHRRYNPLTGAWVTVSPHRLRRPWQGQVEAPQIDSPPVYDPHCYLCPGNERAEGMHNPTYTGTYVFTNDFAALLPEIPPVELMRHPLLHAQSEPGTTRVLCFSPRHDITLPEMPLEGIRAVVDTWGAQVEELGKYYRWVQLFENKGQIMGSSNPHPHGQLWAQRNLPTEVVKEDKLQRNYYKATLSPMLLEYARLEATLQERVVVENQHWLAVVPYWAAWPFEILLLPRYHVLRLSELEEAARNDLASILKRLLTRYDNLFETSFPYSMGWHGAPTDGDSYPHWQLHAHFYPPLLRSATVKKFMVGYEMLGEVQRDLTAEQATQRLLEVSERHYKEVRTR